jgi:membrane-associated phospholipid phosphatase
MVVASYVAASRLHDNKHFLSDVVFGSAIGMATGWTIVGRHGRSEFVLQPMAVHDGFMIALSRVHRAAGAE